MSKNIFLTQEEWQQRMDEARREIAWAQARLEEGRRELALAIAEREAKEGGAREGRHEL